MKLLKKCGLKKEAVCPECKGAVLTSLYKKVKKSNCDWNCPACGEIYRTISMMYQLP